MFFFVQGIVFTNKGAYNCTINLIFKQQKQFTMKLSMQPRPGQAVDVYVSYDLQFSGYGHYKIVASVDYGSLSKKFSHVTNDMEWVDSYNDIKHEAMYDELQQMLHDKAFDYIEEAVLEWLYQLED